MSLADLDPTGTLAAASAAIGLVGTVLRVAPAIKNLGSGGGNKSVSGPSGGPTNNLQRAETVPGSVPTLRQDPERERRAYETVNFVLREIGVRLCAAGLVDEHALTKALTAATQHIEVRLFSGEANRLFESLAPRLADPILVNSVFTSIYLLGALTAELQTSLPNYKDTYVPLGQRLVQQLFWAAIGEDAFRDNLSANLDAFKTLATTAGMLRPTDIGYHTFPKLPTFNPCRYSSKSFTDTRKNKSIYEKLVKHFDRAGFPQPTHEKQEEVGLIRDWRFLSSDTNSRSFDVEKADKTIGENFGRVLHWLLCSADRMPPNQAMIVYFDHHVSLVNWIGDRMGYAILYPGRDLNLSGPHAGLDSKCRAVVESWVILMPCPAAQQARKEHAEEWMQERMKTMAKAPTAVNSVSSNKQTAPAVKPQTPPPTHPAPLPTPPISEMPMPLSPILAPPPPSVEEQLQDVQNFLNAVLKPSYQQLLANLPPEIPTKEFECNRLILRLERNIIDRLDAIQIVNNDVARHRRKDMITECQNMIGSLTTAMSAQPGLPAATDTTLTPPSSTGSPPPYSPDTTSPVNGGQGFPFPGKRTSTVIRRKAPPPPKKFITAKALYDFEPEDEDSEELGFKEGHEIEIVEKTKALEDEGWCKGRIKGGHRIGLMPLEYLEIDQKAPNPLQMSSKPPEKPVPGPQAAFDLHLPEMHNPTHASHNAQTSSTHHDMTSNSLNASGAPHIPAQDSPHPSQPQFANPGPPQQSQPLPNALPPNAQPGNQSHQKPRLTTSKKLEAAGLGVAVVGTVGALAPAAFGGGSQQQPTIIEENVTVQNPPAQDTGAQNENQNNDQQTDDTRNTNSDTAVQDYSNQEPAQPVADLSAFSQPPFDSQPPLGPPITFPLDPAFVPENGPLTPPADPMIPPVDEVFVQEQTTVETVTETETSPFVSPFAALATPAPIEGSIAANDTATDVTGGAAAPLPPDLVEETPSIVTPMTQESPETAVSNAEWTSWEASGVSDDVAFEF